MANTIPPLDTNDGLQTTRQSDVSFLLFQNQSNFKPYLWELAIANWFEPTINSKFEWDDRDITENRTQVNNTAGYNASATSIVVDDAKIFAKYDNAYNPRTGEVMSVTAVNTGTNTLTVVRGVGESAGVAINDNDYLLMIGNAMEERSDAPDVPVYTGAAAYNYTQEFREPVTISNRRRRERSNPAGGISNLTAQAEVQFTRRIESAAFFGKTDLSTSSYTQPVYYTGGILDYIPTANTYTVGGALTEKNWDEFLIEQAFNKGSSEKIMFCGDYITLWMTSFGKSVESYQIPIGTDPLGNAIGFHVSTYITPSGQRLHIVNHELFRGDTTLAGMGVIIDPMFVGARYGQDPETNYDGRPKYVERDYMQYTGNSSFEAEYYAEVGFEWRNAQTHALIETVTKPT